MEWLHSLPFTSGSQQWICLEPLKTVFLVDGWRTGVLNSPCFPLCALSYSWKCSAWGCMSTSPTTKIWQVGNHTRSQNNQLAIEISYVLWLGKGLTGTDSGKRRWSSRNHSNAQCFISVTRASAEGGSHFAEGFGFWECSQIWSSEPWPNESPDTLCFFQVSTPLRMWSYQKGWQKITFKCFF